MIADHTDILVVDEALAVGDTMFQRKCFKRMEDFRKAGKTITMVSHDMQIIRTFYTHAVLIDGGRILEEGEPDYIVNTYYGLLSNREESHFSNRRDTR